MKFVVKNTTKFGILDLLCPHPCRGCGRLGSVLCERCKKNLFSEINEICPLCKREVARNAKNDTINHLGNSTPLCPDCELPFQAVFVSGWRTGTLAQLIKDYKYRSVRAAGPVLAELLDHTIADHIKSPAQIVVVPLPTIGKHVRARGLDHTNDLAQRLAKRRGWQCRRVLGRKTDTIQVGATMKQRQDQAARSYTAVLPVDEQKTYLLLDDIWTTGASILAAAKVLRAAGAKNLMVAILATGKARATKQSSDQ